MVLEEIIWNLVLKSHNKQEFLSVSSDCFGHIPVGNKAMQKSYEANQNYVILCFESQYSYPYYKYQVFIITIKSGASLHHFIYWSWIIMSLWLWSKKNLANDFSVNFEKFRKVQSNRKKYIIILYLKYPRGYQVVTGLSAWHGFQNSVSVTWMITF